MTSKRPLVLIVVLLAALLAYFVPALLREHYPELLDPELKVLPGVSAITKVDVQRKPDGSWEATVDYFYTGAPRSAGINIEQFGNRGLDHEPLLSASIAGHTPKKGQHRITQALMRPLEDAIVITREVRAQLRDHGKPFSTMVAKHDIRWGDRAGSQVEQSIALGQTGLLIEKAQILIDDGRHGSLLEARRLLQQVIEKQPQTDAAYVELARVAMKTNWSPEGLGQAEALVRSALQIRPASDEAKVLLGYVYAHQGRYKDSEALFAEAAAAGSKNLWLWANWGEVLEMQGRTAAAIQKYREGVSRPLSEAADERGRQAAYPRLFALLETRKEFDALEVLHKQRTREYGGGICSNADYARFLVLQRGDAAAAIALLRDAPVIQCPTDIVRQVMGLAHYLAWAGDSSPQAPGLLREARVYLPVGPVLLYQLGMSERTVPVVQRLAAEGEKVDQVDGNEMTALAYALQAKDFDVTQRLLKLGARADAQVGAEKMPVALLPVLARDFQAIRLLQRSGTDYTKLRYRGSTAVDHARSTGDGKLLQALDPRQGAL